MKSQAFRIFVVSVVDFGPVSKTIYSPFLLNTGRCSFQNDQKVRWKVASPFSPCATPVSLFPWTSGMLVFWFMKPKPLISCTAWAVCQSKVQELAITGLLNLSSFNSHQPSSCLFPFPPFLSPFCIIKKSIRCEKRWSHRLGALGILPSRPSLPGTLP